MLSPKSRARFLELSREYRRLDKRWVNTRHQLLSRTNLSEQQRNNMINNMNKTLGKMAATSRNINAYKVASPKVRGQELAARREGKAGAIWANVVGRHRVGKAEKMLGGLTKKWNAMYGPRSPGGRRTGPVNKNFELTLQVRTPRTPRAKTASPGPRSAPSPRARSANARMGRFGRLHNNSWERVMGRLGVFRGEAHDARTWSRNNKGRVHRK